MKDLTRRILLKIRPGGTLRVIIYPFACASDAVFGTELKGCYKCKCRENAINDKWKGFVDKFFPPKRPSGKLLD